MLKNGPNELINEANIKLICWKVVNSIL